MNLKKMLLLLLLLVINNFYGQSKKVADRYFNEFSYQESAKLYKALFLKKGDSSKHVLSRLADSYYNNANTQEAEIWYAKLVDNYKENLEVNYLFKYAQVLRSNGKYKKSDSLFLKIASTEKSNNRTEELKKENYLLDYSKKDIRIGVRNLAINTEYSDFGGFLLNGKAYFASSVSTGGKKERIYKWNNQPFLNIYMADEEIATMEESVRDTVLMLNNPRVMGKPITSDFHDSSPVFTKDGKTIYFTRNNISGKRVRKDKKNTSNLKIYKASFVNGYWMNVKELPFNNDAYSIGHPALSPDEKTMYFVSNMPGGFGSSDIYKVEIKDNDEYGVPANLGETINTSDKEMFPFVGKDNTLYFSSNGHLGLGLLDIFQSKIKEDNTYSKVKNLGYPFNSKRDDFSFFINENGKKGFFSSNRKDGKGDDDIYSFYLYTDPPICKQSIEGIVTERTEDKLPIDGATIKLVNDKGVVISEALSNKEGKYIFKDILCNNKYTVFADKLDHRSITKKEVALVEGNDVSVNLDLIPLIKGNQIIINPIYFDYGKSLIREDAQYELENIVTVMSNHPEVIIKIESHTDSRGPSSYNRMLSDKRAKATRDYVLSRGIAKNRIESAIGYGEDQLLNDCVSANEKCTESEHQKNRRSYFYIVKGSEKIKARQAEQRKVVQKRITKRNNFLQFLRKNFKKTGKPKKGRDKCVRGEEENCADKGKNFKINYKN